MAKKKTTSKKTAAHTSLVGPEVTTSVHVDKEDLIAVGLSRAEEEMQRRCSAAQERAEQARKDSEAKRREASEALQEHAQETTEAYHEPVREAATTLGIKKISMSTSHHGAQRLADGYAKKYTVRFNASPEGGKTNDFSFEVSRAIETKVPSNVLSLLNESDQFSAAASQADEEALHWKRQLSRLPQHERKLRAQLAEQRLASTEEGEQLLSAMQLDLDNGLLALPAPKVGK